MDLPKWPRFITSFLFFTAATLNANSSNIFDECSNLFRHSGNEIHNNAFMHAFGHQTQKARSLMERTVDFQNKWPGRVKLVDDVTFKFEEEIGRAQRSRKVLALSLKNLDPVETEKLLDDYVNHLSWNSISFPLGEKGGHLHTRIGYSNLDFYESFGTADYRFSVGKRLETIVSLADEEFTKLRQYADNIEKLGSKEVIGELSHDGPRSRVTGATLAANKPEIGGHNCTSWIASAPIGQNGETLQQLLGLGELNVHTHPGWWTAGIQTMGAKDRIPYVIYMSRDETLDEIQHKLSGNILNWDYDLH